MSQSAYRVTLWLAGFLLGVAGTLHFLVFSFGIAEQHNYSEDGPLLHVASRFLVLWPILVGAILANTVLLALGRVTVRQNQAGAAFLSCPACSQAVSLRSAACPNCGLGLPSAERGFLLLLVPAGWLAGELAFLCFAKAMNVKDYDFRSLWLPLTSTAGIATAVGAVWLSTRASLFWTPAPAAATALPVSPPQPLLAAGPAAVPGSAPRTFGSAPALVPCAACQKPISPAAPTCVGCGHPQAAVAPSR